VGAARDTIETDDRDVGALMNTPLEREGLLTRMTAAFARKDNKQILEAMRPDVEIVVPGDSPLSGHHRGTEEVARFLRGLERVFVPAGTPIEYSHVGHDMIVTQLLRAQATLWTHHYRITFDRSGRIERIVFRPDDVPAFERLVGTESGAVEASE
jgi:ketosteroid isomerase-like protein